MKSHLFLSTLVLGLSLAAVGCGDDNPASATPVDPKFTATLIASNETTTVVGGDVNGSGTVTITMHNTKDASGNITASNADFTVTLQGFPAGTVLTGAHIHPGAAGVAGSVIWNLGLATGEITLPNGSATFTKNAVTPNDVATAQGILNNPAGFYFNVHTTVNTGGAVRGQLVRAN